MKTLVDAIAQARRCAINSGGQWYVQRLGDDWQVLGNIRLRDRLAICIAHPPRHHRPPPPRPLLRLSAPDLRLVHG